MSIDSIRIKDKFNFGKKYLEAVNRIISFSKEEFMERLDLQLQAERLFEVLSQIILDVCTHIVAHSNVQAPQSYIDCMNRLSELGILPQEKISTFSSLIKMRNLIVHQYGDIDHSILFNALKILLEDFKEYQTFILTWLEE
ncbi:MAG: DUF86 domain-containing protein [Candidatus Heimdallarchaeota archaeon]